MPQLQRWILLAVAEAPGSNKLAGDGDSGGPVFSFARIEPGERSTKIIARGIFHGSQVDADAARTHTFFVDIADVMQRRDLDIPIPQQ